ncbi:tyrosine-protein kinase family protein [Atopomonas hussainii]|uniref:tyrosine-protein kinase family protein n=1 Tax=Atopomonas hussainii TaxID=1429083 RepID=UPI0009000262|nr:hypothetical protein [Atopomonas hussainii]
MNAANRQAPPQPNSKDQRLSLPMQELMARVLREARAHRLKQLLLVGVARKVGTSFITEQAATELAPAFGQVLIIEVSPSAAVHELLDGDLNRLCAPGQAVAKVSVSLETCLNLFGIGRDQTQDLFTRLNQHFSLVLWDMPPPTLSPASLIAANCMDGVVLVVEANKTRRQVAQYVAQRLEESGGNLLGLVLNRTLNFIPEWLYRWL